MDRKINSHTKRKVTLMGSGCGSVGRAVASDTRGPRFESSYRQKKIYILNIWLLSTVYWKDKNKEKRGRERPIFLKKEKGHFTNEVKNIVQFIF